MAKSNGKKGKGRRKAGSGSLMRSLLIIAIAVLILGVWYNANKKTFDARMADIGFQAGVIR